MGIRWKDRFATERVWPNGYGEPSVERLKPSYDGEVVGITGDTERVMSDVWEYLTYAMVVHDGKLDKVHIGTSGFESMTDGPVTIDAPPALMATAFDILKARETARLRAEHARSVDDAIADAEVPRRGKTVVVARGRKVPKGTTGELFWMGAGRFGTRVGVRDAKGDVHWTALANVDVLNPDDSLDIDALRRVPDFDARTSAYATRTLAAWGNARREAA